MDMDVYREKRKEVISKFVKGFNESHRNDHVYHNCLELLIRDIDPYTVIEMLLDQRIEMFNQMEKMAHLIKPDATTLRGGDQLIHGADLS